VGITIDTSSIYKILPAGSGQKTNPIQTQFNPIQTQFKPIQSQFNPKQTQFKAKTNPKYPSRNPESEPRGTGFILNIYSNKLKWSNFLKSWWSLAFFPLQVNICKRQLHTQIWRRMQHNNEHQF